MEPKRPIEWFEEHYHEPSVTLKDAAYVTIAFVVFLAALMAIVVWSARPAGAHDALPTSAQPQGWKYPFSCCSGYDCREIGDSRSTVKERVYETAVGYRFSTSNEVVEHGDPRIKDSPDGKFHWCTVAGATDSRTICLFVPPRSY